MPIAAMMLAANEKTFCAAGGTPVVVCAGTDDKGTEATAAGSIA